MHLPWNLLIIPALHCSCCPTLRPTTHSRTRRLVDWWISKAPSGSHQLGRPRPNFAAGRAAGEAQTLGDKRHPGDLGTTECGAHALAAAACTFHKLQRGPLSIYCNTCPLMPPRGQRSQVKSVSVFEVCAPSGSRRDPLEPLRCRLSIHSNSPVALESKGRQSRARPAGRANGPVYFVQVVQALNGPDDLLGRKVRLELGDTGLRG